MTDKIPFIHPPKIPQALLDQIAESTNEFRSRSGVTFGLDTSHRPDVTVLAIGNGARIMLSAGGDVPASINREWINGFNASRKADREALALAFTTITTIATARGFCTVQREEPANPGFSGAGIALKIFGFGVGVSIDLDNLHGGAFGLAHWYNVEPGARQFSQELAIAVRDKNTSRGGRLYHKATTCGRDWYSLAIYVDRGLMIAARGGAFAPSVS